MGASRKGGIGVEGLVHGLERRIADRQSELEQLLAERSDLDGRIQAVEDALQHYRAILELEKGTARPAASEFRGASIREAALMILGAAGEPLHVTELWNRMAAGGLRLRTQTPKASINSTLTRYPGLFENIGGRTWRLVGEHRQDELLGFSERTGRT